MTGGQRRADRLGARIRALGTPTGIALAAGVFFGGVAGVLGGCAATTEPKAADSAPAKKEVAEGFEARGEKSGGVFHSKRFRLSLPLPDGRAWRIDDHSRPYLFATHEATRSRLSLIGTHEASLMNRERCENRAKELGFVPDASLSTVDDETSIVGGSYDARVRVAMGVDARTGALDGHVFLFGAFLRQCLLVHVETSVPSPGEEATLAARLAEARARIVRGITLDPPRTTVDAEVPRATQSGIR